MCCPCFRSIKERLCGGEGPLIGIIGIGNILYGDDGVGVHVIRRLKECDLKGVELVDGGTASYSLPVHRYDRLIIVDSVKSSHHPPGSILKFTKDDILRSRVKGTSHDIDLCDYIYALEFKGEAPEEIYLIGVVPENLEPMELSLSERVESVIPEVIKLIREIVGAWMKGT